MRIDFFIKLSYLCICALLFSSCEPKEKTPEPKVGNSSDRELMLAHYADEIIIPSYANFKVKLDELVSRSQKFTNNPCNDSLIGFRNAWIDAYIEWQKVELFDVGPASDIILRNSFNIYPTSDSLINVNISSGTANLDFPSNNKAQGFPALDYLINGLGATDNDILVFYTSAPDAAKRIAYVNKIITQMKNSFAYVYSQWTGGFRNTFVSKTSIDASSSTSLMINGYVLNYERFIRSGKFGIPSGAMASGTINPEKVEAYYYKDTSRALAKAAHNASVNFFNGKSVKTGIEGPSLKTYLNSLGAKDSQTGNLLSDVINAQFVIVNSKITPLNRNLYQQILTNNQAMKDVYNEMQTMVGFLKVDMTSAMSITINYFDNDGD